jgi:hypothetical protein
MDSDRIARVIKELEDIADEGSKMPPLGGDFGAAHITNLGKVAGAIDILTEVKASEALIQIVSKVKAKRN